MKFKIDENLPLEAVEMLQQADYDAIAIYDQGLNGESDQILSQVCQQENRILVTFDLDFADIRRYPPAQYPGIIVLRLPQQDKPYVLLVFQKLIPKLTLEPLENHLWIVEENRLRIRS
ncbi:MAG: DUF5615 family PIN-like protein [Elainellaceae cyanobacterium]